MTLTDGLFIMSLTCQAGLLTALFRFGRSTPLPFLTSYMIYLDVSYPLIYMYYRRALADQYEWVYVLTAIPDYIFQTAIILEVIGAIVKPLRAQIPHVINNIVISIMCCSAFWSLWMISSQHFSAFDHLGQVFIRIDLGFSLFRIAALGLTLALMRLLGIGWQKLDAKVAIGLSFYAMVALLVALAHQMSRGMLREQELYVQSTLFQVAGWIATTCYLTVMLYINKASVTKKKRAILPLVEYLGYGAPWANGLMNKKRG